MSKRSVFTTISPLPAGIPRHVVLDFLHNHLEMIDLNPLVKERHPIKPPADAPQDELKCIWYSLTDRITYLPGGLASGDISYTCAFHDLPDGIQTHCRAPLNVDIRDKWTLCGTLTGEPPQPVELGLGAPATGLYIREDVDLRCNILMTAFVKKNLKKSHATLVDHLVEKARHVASLDNDSVRTGQSPLSATAGEKPVLFPPPQTSQNQPPSHGGRETPSETRRSPPPQLGSPFVPGYEPGRAPSMRYPSPITGEQRHNTPPVIYYRSHSQSQPVVSFNRLDHHQPAAAAAQGHPAAHALPPMRLQAPHRYSQPPLPPQAYHYDGTLYPQPLRVRNMSVGSANLTQPIPGVGTMSPNANSSTGGGARTSSYRSSGSFSSCMSTPTAATSNSGDDHPEYPSLNPYAAGGPPDEPSPPRAPLVFAELAGCEGPRRVGKEEEEGKSHAGVDALRHHPTVLRPGGRSGMRPRLDSPFTAELE
jgi:hypothetical protein